MCFFQTPKYFSFEIKICYNNLGSGKMTNILIVEDDATTRSASLLYDEAFFIFVIITIDFPQQHLFSRRS